jgi:hypothetical protein
MNTNGTSGIFTVSFEAGLPNRLPSGSFDSSIDFSLLPPSLSATAPVFQPAADKRKALLREANTMCLARRIALAMASSSVPKVLASVEGATASTKSVANCGVKVSPRNQGKSNGAKKRRQKREAAAAAAAEAELAEVGGTKG